jgi:hypothetical protein
MLIAMVAAVLLITDFVLPRGVSFLLSGLTGLWFVAFWLLLPWMRRDWGEPDDDTDERRENPEPFELPRKTTDR